MDVLKAEIQALRKEVDDLRNENIALYNELTKQNKTLCEEILALRQQNIDNFKELERQHTVLHNTIRFFGGESKFDHLEKYLNRLAGMQTAEFIFKNIPKVIAFDDRERYLEYILKQADDSGQYLEFGVFQGKSINFISALKPYKIIYGFDSFEGLPEDWFSASSFRKGHFSLNGKMPQVNKNVRLIKGWFNDTLPTFVKEHPEPCAFIHLDCDLYSSAKTVFAELKNQIVPGTIIAFDDYFDYPGWQEGEYKAFMEFVEENHLEFEYIARTNSIRVAVKIK